MRQRFSFCLLGGAAITLLLVIILSVLSHVARGHVPGATFFRYALLPGILAGQHLAGVLRSLVFVIVNCLAYALVLFIIRSLMRPLKGAAQG